jgi:hypothetical protein
MKMLTGFRLPKPVVILEPAPAPENLLPAFDSTGDWTNPAPGIWRIVAPLISTQTLDASSRITVGQRYRLDLTLTGLSLGVQVQTGAVSQTLGLGIHVLSFTPASKILMIRAPVGVAATLSNVFLRLD